MVIWIVFHPWALLSKCCNYIDRKFHVDVCLVFLVRYVEVDLQCHMITIFYHLRVNLPVFKEAVNCCTLLLALGEGNCLFFTCIFNSFLQGTCNTITKIKHDMFKVLTRLTIMTQFLPFVLRVCN